MRVYVLPIVILTGCAFDVSSADNAPRAAEWTCIAGCYAAINPLAYSTEVRVAANSVTYESPSPDVRTTHAGEANGDCIDVPAGDDWGVVRDAYTLCVDDGGTAEAVITWRSYPGPAAPRTYVLRAPVDLPGAF